MPTIDEILQDVNAHPDADVIIGEGDKATKVKLSDLRGWASTRDKTANEYYERAKTLEQTLLQRGQAEAAALAEQERRLRQELAQQTRQTQQQPDAYDFSDGYSKQLFPRIEDIIKQAVNPIKEEYNKNFQQISQAAQGLTRMLLETKATQDYQRYEWPEGYDVARAFKEAMDAGIFDRTTGTPDLGRYNQFVMQPVRAQKELQTAIEKAKAEGREAALKEMQNRQRGKFRVVPNPSLNTGKGKQGKEAASLGEFFNSDQSEPSDDEISAAAKMFGRS